MFYSDWDILIYKLAECLSYSTLNLFSWCDVKPTCYSDNYYFKDSTS